MLLVSPTGTSRVREVVGVKFGFFCWISLKKGYAMEGLAAPFSLRLPYSCRRSRRISLMALLSCDNSQAVKEDNEHASDGKINLNVLLETAVNSKSNTLLMILCCNSMIIQSALYLDPCLNFSMLFYDWLILLAYMCIEAYL
ncbi:unnamed protein product [Brugia pahangi]|uniref:Transmembrane protein n=1 Tax=Brugia pahangi TaxID=6280 RepID=A0A0N4TRE1_BRUPA|nr:unnamed protein product [Brugia pahangi]